MMSLFGKKKEVAKPVKIEKLPPLPEFPDLPRESNLDMPSYESSMGNIKKEVERDELPQIPTRNSPATPHFAAASMEASDKPLFVRIESYRAAVNEVDKIKEKVAQAEELLEDLDDIRQKEAQKLEAWRRDIGMLKEKLLSVDKNLFDA